MTTIGGGFAPPQASPQTSGFDASWYLQQNPDVAGAGLDPYQHYLMFGQSEGRLPGPQGAPLGDLRPPPPSGYPIGPPSTGTVGGGMQAPLAFGGQTVPIGPDGRPMFSSVGGFG